MRKTLKENDNYEIDENGNIYNKENGYKLKRSRYIWLNKKSYKYKNLIANNLIPNPNNYSKVGTIDGNSENLDVSNIEWGETVYGRSIFDKKTDKYLRGKITTLKNHCYNRKSVSYKDYGLKGLTVCKEWVENTLSFVKWSKENGYFEGAWLSRYDKNKGFTPDNCYWGEPNIKKLNCDMVSDIKNKLKIFEVKDIATKYQVCKERVRQIKNGATLKRCE